MKILHCADLHIREKDLDECAKVLNFIEDQARAETPDLIVVAGDVFDSHDVRFDSGSSRLAFSTIVALANEAPVVIPIGTPSHDGLCSELFRYARVQYPIWVSDRPEQIYLCDGEIRIATEPGMIRPDQVQAVISMVPQPTKKWFQGKGGIFETDTEIAAGMGQIFGGFGAMAAGFPYAPHILVGHFSVHGAHVSETQQMIGREIEIQRDVLELARADLGCLGHIHLAQEVLPNWFYSGSTYCKDYGEMDRKGFYIHEIDTDLGNPNRSEWSLNSRWIETPTRKLEKLEINLAENGGGFDELDMSLYALSPEEVQGAHLRIEIQVYQDEAGKVDRDAIQNFYTNGDSRAASVNVRLIRIPRENVRSQNILKLRRLPDKLQERATILQEPIPDGVLDMARDLESKSPDEILAEVAAL